MNLIPESARGMLSKLFEGFYSFNYEDTSATAVVFFAAKITSTGAR